MFLRVKRRTIYDFLTKGIIFDSTKEAKQIFDYFFSLQNKQYTRPYKKSKQKEKQNEWLFFCSQQIFK